ncbi:MAG: hypothetical protein ICV73_00435 [Acetobacteraceae bacterium]|nr:hypothetical protein [Acetobacteraceae bacterium]
MEGLWASFGIGFVAGLRSMSAGAALAWAASLGRTRSGWVPNGVRSSRGLLTAAALAEMAGDKMPFAPDRRIAISVLVRLVLGAAGGAALAGRGMKVTDGALAGMAGAVAGTLLGRAARGGEPLSGGGWSRGLAEDAVAAGLAAVLVRSAPRRGRA